MNFYKQNIAIFFFTALVTLIPKIDFAQNPTTYKMDFIRACSDSSKKGRNIMTVFKVTPTIKDFKLILSMRVFYELANGKEILSVIKQNEDNIKIIIFGKNIKEKNKFVYEFIKDKVEIEKENEDVYFIALVFYNLTKEDVEKMSITYGLWESDNPDVRNENKYNFIVEKVDNTFIQNIMKQ